MKKKKKNKQLRDSQIYSINLQKNFTGFNLKPKGLRLALLRGDVVSKEAKSVHLLVVGTARVYLTIRPVARKGYGSIAHEAKPNGLLTRGPWGRRV